ncbi:MAG: GyrI-like domain-containing protein [Bacteroidota bacterium]
MMAPPRGVRGGIRVLNKKVIGEAHNAIIAWLEPNGYRVAGPVREYYLYSPGDTNAPARYVTEIQVPVERA